MDERNVQMSDRRNKEENNLIMFSFTIELLPILSFCLDTIYKDDIILFHFFFHWKSKLFPVIKIHEIYFTTQNSFIVNH